MTNSTLLKWLTFTARQNPVQQGSEPFRNFYMEKRRRDEIFKDSILIWPVLNQIFSVKRLQF
jgi:hypothetical protein